MKIAIYTRVSTSMQVDDGHSIDSQKRLLTEYSKAREWQVHKIYSDEGISAKNLNRPSLQKLLDDAKSKSFDAILVWKLSRFSRSLKDLLVTIDYLDKYDISLISYAENIDLSTAIGRLMFNVIGSFSEFERETISENMKMSLEQAVQNGFRNIAHCFGYRVKNKKFVIDKKEAKIVNELFDYYLKTKNVAETTRYAQSKGYKSHRGNLLPYNSVHVILRNVTYVGYSSFKKTIPYKQKIVPQIVDEAKFDKVQRLLKKNCSKYAASNVKTVREWLNA